MNGIFFCTTCLTFPFLRNLLLSLIYLCFREFNNIPFSFFFFFSSFSRSYLPTPLLGQDMTQGLVNMDIWLNGIWTLYDYLMPNWLIGLVSRVFANSQGDLDSIPSHVIPKTLKKVLDTSLLNPQRHKVRIKGKVEQSRERSRALPYTLV